MLTGDERRVVLQEGRCNEHTILSAAGKQTLTGRALQSLLHHGNIMLLAATLRLARLFSQRSGACACCSSAPGPAAACAERTLGPDAEEWGVAGFQMPLMGSLQVPEACCCWHRASIPRRAQPGRGGAGAAAELSLLDRQPPVEQEQQAPVPKQEPGQAADSQRQAIMAVFRRVQTFVGIVEIDADTLKRKKIKQYMQSARAGLEELVDMWATGSVVPEGGQHASA